VPCLHDEPQSLYFHPRCHPHAKLVVVYDAGLVIMRCGRCQDEIGAIEVAP
jgi:hypothetical protein